MKKFLFLTICFAVMTSAINAQSEGWKGVKATYNNFELEDFDAISSFSLKARRVVFPRVSLNRGGTAEYT